MPINLTCAECGHQIEGVADYLAGQAIKCAECHGLNRVPTPEKKAKPAPAPKPAPASPLTIRYRCPFCNSDQPPVWRNYWTPVSTIVFCAFLVPTAAVACLWTLSMVFLSLAGAAGQGDGPHLETTIPAVIGGIIGFGVLLAFYFLSGSSVVCEARQVCPDCDVRLS